MTKRIFRSIFIVAVSVFLSSVTIFMGVLYDYFTGVSKSQLKTQTELAARAVEREGISYFDNLQTDNYRITWIDNNGSVLYDSSKNSAEMENHLEREEIKEAMKNGYGESSRYSSTLTERSLYSAKSLSDGTILRVSVAQNSILTLLFGMTQSLSILFAVVLVISLLLASRLSKSIVKPLNDINLDEPLKNKGYDELSPFLNRIAAQQKRIRLQSDELSQKQIEFETVTEGMHEGIVLLNDKGKILSMNKAGEKLLNVSPDFLGTDILTVNHSYELQELMRKAYKGEPCESKIKFGSSEYQLNASPVNTQGSVFGIVLLIFDITEKEKAEQMRREFTANVSHELKTPLHTISGCAELLKNNMVAAEDVSSFAEKIYTESGRMISLVEDIIKLSHLDEGASDMQREIVDLYDIAVNTVRSLMPVAESVGVILNVTGTPSQIYGIPQLLQGVIYNLCDNAIKYNVAGGSVNVNVSSESECVILTVSDSGIGIPAEHQERIFERFYRVDKSHSKEVGGTGLGLSIVKHAVKLHNGEIEIRSVVDKGTTMIITLPKDIKKL